MFTLFVYFVRLYVRHILNLFIFFIQTSFHVDGGSSLDDPWPVPLYTQSIRSYKDTAEHRVPPSIWTKPNNFF